MDSLSVSPWALFLQAGVVGKSVMGLLLLLSIWCWVLIVEGAVAAMRLRGAVNADRLGRKPRLLAPVLLAGLEGARSGIPGENVSEARARIEQAMQRAGRSLVRRLEGGLPNLAIISSVSPFIGLFGTVWGIMSSFSAIAAAQDSSLAVVAPGIAEALATTAFGLAAAIPASVGYSRVGAAMGSAAAELGDLIEERALEMQAPREALVREAA